ncbi:MAG: hypothetical protein GX752_07520 [Clostridium sp.]|nr:hypothetical protein [Clostridium sp.]
MFFYNLGMFVTMVIIVVLALIQIGSEEEYHLNRIYQKEFNGMRVLNKLYFICIVPWLFIPFINLYYFKFLYIIFLLFLILALEDSLYVYSLVKEKNKEKLIVMITFNIIIIGLIYIINIRFLNGQVLINIMG